MGSRGRGRGGRGSSFSREQLNALGAGEVLPGPLTEPPPLFPPLEHKPIRITQSMEMDYMLILKQDFIDNIQMSGAYLNLSKKQTEQPKQIDKLVAQLPQVKLKFDWKLLPSELRPKVTGKRIRVNSVKNEDIQLRLSQLERLEEKDAGVVNAKEEKDDNEAEEELVDFGELEEDEEMDDGTDYANNYFDNGEDYEDDDDNLDDGAIY